jgi:hypothetical protein
MQHWKSVAIAPGKRALAVMPSSAHRFVAPTTKSTFAVFDCP